MDLLEGDPLLARNLLVGTTYMICSSAKRTSSYQEIQPPKSLSGLLELKICFLNFCTGYKTKGMKRWRAFDREARLILAIL